MKLVDHSNDSWAYQLTPQEADLLRSLLKRFPLGRAAKPRISQNNDGPADEDRQKLLEESLTEHRRDLKRLARSLLGEEQWQAAPPGTLLTLTSELREILLQILNDVRMGCWRALGEPDDLAEVVPTEPTAAGHRTLMDLAGFFEMHLLDPDGVD
jgi:hypothetical protein